MEPHVAQTCGVVVGDVGKWLRALEFECSHGCGGGGEMMESRTCGDSFEGGDGGGSEETSEEVWGGSPNTP